MLKRFLCFFSLFVLISFFFHIFYLYNNRNFTPDQFVKVFQKGEKIDLTLSEKKDLSYILSQKFTYLDQGQQMSAFESEDHKFVIKFFHPRRPLKERHFESFKKMLSLNSLHFLNKAYFKRQKRLKTLFARYKKGYHLLRQETALVYAHLSENSALDINVEVLDKRNKSYFLDLKKTAFVLQKKVKLAGPYLKKIIQEKKEKELKILTASLKELFIERAKKGITDPQQTLHNNYGFLENRAVQIDIGKIFYSKTIEDNPEVEIDRVLSSLKKKWPELTL